MTDLRLCELIAARICHDLVGPVGAVANGVELMAEGGADPEIMRLIADSAAAASRRLQAYRIAFGSANALPDKGCVSAVRELAATLFSAGKIALEWPTPAPEIDAVADRRFAKLLLTLIVVALDGAVRSSSVRVSLSSDYRSIAAAVRTVGGQARLTDEVRAGLEGLFDLARSTPKAAPAYVAACLVRELAGTLSVSASDGDFEMRLVVPVRP